MGVPHMAAAGETSEHPDKSLAASQTETTSEAKNTGPGFLLRDQLIKQSQPNAVRQFLWIIGIGFLISENTCHPASNLFIPPFMVERPAVVQQVSNLSGLFLLINIKTELIY